MGDDVTMAVALLIEDLAGRSGFDGLWDSLDEDIKDEIRANFDEIVRNAVAMAKSKAT